jgi:hypothetical protein
MQMGIAKVHMRRVASRGCLCVRRRSSGCIRRRSGLILPRTSGDSQGQGAGGDNAGVAIPEVHDHFLEVAGSAVGDFGPGALWFYRPINDHPRIKEM